MKLMVFGAVGVVIVAFTLFMMDMSYDNTEQRLRTSFEDQGMAV